MEKRLSALAICLALMAATSGCAPLPVLREIGASFNEELRSPLNNTNAGLDSEALSKEYFIGLALSGGGSRAANFSASVMWELDQLGVLEHVQYISAVSGSALPAAYYALFKNDVRKWNRNELRRIMSQCFECWLWIYLANPLQLIKFLGTSYDRSDVMSDVFSNRVFDGKTFGGLKHPSPRLILNATSYIDGERFLFVNDQFDAIKSELSTFRIADAVMASAAYPGGFRTVTLKDFQRSDSKRTFYVHLFDGGITDNLGIDSLLQIHERRVLNLGEQAFPKGCFFIVVDAYSPYLEREQERRPDTRGWYDLVIDSNISNAFSVLLLTKRNRALRSLGFDIENWEDAAREIDKPENARRPIGFLEQMKSERLVEHPLDTSREVVALVQRKRAKCKVWHISLTQIGLALFKPPGRPTLPELYRKDYEQRYQNELKMSYDEFSKSIRDIPTRFLIKGSNARNLQIAGELLVQEENSRRIVCSWLKCKAR